MPGGAAGSSSSVRSWVRGAEEAFLAGQSPPSPDARLRRDHGTCARRRFRRRMARTRSSGSRALPPAVSISSPHRARSLSTQLGSIVVENRGGAGGTIGSTAVANPSQTATYGSTLRRIPPHLITRSCFDPSRILPACRFGAVPNVLRWRRPKGSRRSEMVERARAAQ